MRDAASFERAVTQIFVADLNLPEPQPEADLIQLGVLDSLAFVELLVQLEARFGITITPSEFDLENFRSVARIAAFLSRRESNVEAGLQAGLPRAEARCLRTD